MLSFYEQTTDNNTLSPNPMSKEQNSTKNQSNYQEKSLKRAMENLITRRKLHGCYYRFCKYEEETTTLFDLKEQRRSKWSSLTVSPPPSPLPPSATAKP
jgi:hypothetical protein